MKAILLARVSTSAQSTDPQLEKLIEFAKREGFKEKNLKIINTVESGLASSEDRVGTNELRRAYEEDNDYKTVICSELSRISRKQSLLHQIKEWLKENHIQLIVINPELRLLDSNGNINATTDLVFTLSSALAEQETATKKERFLTARKYFSARGESLTGKVTFGYMKYLDDSSKKKKFTLHKENSRIVKEIFNWYLHGIPNIGKSEVSARIIARYCMENKYPKQTHSKRNILNILNDTAYTGEKVHFYQGGASPVTVPYPIIVSREDFESVKAKLAQANTAVEKSTKVTLLSKTIICPSCSNKYVANYSFVGEIDRSSYRCGSRNKVIPCKNKQTIEMKMIDSSIWSLLVSNTQFSKNLIKDEADILGERQEGLKQRIINLSAELLQIEEKINHYKNIIQHFVNDGTFEENEVLYKAMKQRDGLKKKQAKSYNEKLKLESKISSMESYIANIEILKSELQTLETDKELIKRYISTLVKSVDIVYHKRELSVFVINFAHPFFPSTNISSSLNITGNDCYPITLVIEKRNPKKKKLFWINGLSKVENNSLSIFDPNDNSYSNGLKKDFEITLESIHGIEALTEVEMLDLEYDYDEISGKLRQIPFRQLKFPQK